MAVLAHPDDESLGFGGVLARYAAEGIEPISSPRPAASAAVSRHSARRGASRPRGDGAIRVAELEAAALVLGIKTLRVLDYMDGELDQAEPREVIARIASELRRARPHVVVTFDSFGGYGHPDHIAICQLTTAAVVAAADRNAEGVDRSFAPHAVTKLYYLVLAGPAWEAYQAAFKRLVAQVDGVERGGHPYPEWAITTRIDTRAHWPTVWRAASCHESQISGYEKLRHLSPEHHEGLWGTQTYYRAMSTVNGGRRRETDLFEGLRHAAPVEPARDS
jgi:LmbE family N-acetylglucosaminyl deacetylase